MIEIALAALGNRAWGHSPAFKPVGVMVTAFAFAVAFPALWNLSGWVAELVWFGRVFSTRPLHHPSNDWPAAILRTYAWVPLFVFVAWATGEQWRLLFAMLCPLIAVLYLLDDKYSPLEKLVLVELVVGAYIGSSFIQ